MDSFMGISKPLQYVPETNTAISDAAGDVVQDKKAQLQNAFNASLANANPEREAEAQILAKETGLPVAAIRQNLDEVKRQKTQREFEQQDLLKRFPHTAAFMSQGDNAALVTDDFQNLQAFEKLLNPLNEQRPTGGFIPNMGRTALSSIPRFSQSFYRVGADLMGMGDDWIGQPFTNITGLELFFGHAENWLNRRRDQTQAVADGLQQPTMGGGFIERNVMNATNSIATQIPGMAATIITRNPEFALGYIGATTGGQAYDQARQQGLSPTRSVIYGLGQGGTEMVFERIPLLNLMSDLKVGSGLGQTIFRQLLSEVPSEAATTVVQNFNEWASLNPDKPFSTYLAQLPSDLADTVMATTLATGFQTSALHTLDRYANGRGAAQMTQEQANFINQLHMLSSASKLRERDPQSFEQFIAQATEDSDVKDVYIDGKTLSQSGVDLSQLSDEVKKQVTDSAETGGTVRIPVEQYAARLAPVEGADALLDHLKLSPNAMSRAEAAVYMQEEGQALQAEIEKTLATRADDRAFQDSRSTVEQNILDQLNGVARFTEDVNRSNAALAGQFYAVQAARLGVTPEELYSRYPLRVRASLGTGLSFAQTDAAKLEQAREQGFDTGTLIYHSSPEANITAFDPNRLGRGVDQEGPGVYTSSDIEDSKRYLGKEGSGRTYKLYGKLNRLMTEQSPLDWAAVERIIRAAPNYQYDIFDWGENEQAAMQNIRENYQAYGDPREVMKSVWYDFYKNDPADYMRNAVAETGYLGMSIDKAGGITHHVFWEPSAIRDMGANFDPSKTGSSELLAQSAVQPSEDTLKRNELGFYSAVAREISKMNLPAWKPNPKKALTEDERNRLNKLNETRKAPGARSYGPNPEYDTLVEREREAAGLASGADIWAKVKSLPVKKEELEWLGLEDFLQTRDKHTRNEVLDFINGNGVRVEETVADQTSGEGGELIFDEGEADTDSSNWEYRVEDFVEELKEDPETEAQAILNILRDETNYIQSNFEPAADMSLSEMNESEEVKSWVRDNFADELATKIEEVAQAEAEARAEEEYMQDPVMLYFATTPDGDLVEIRGNSNYGYEVLIGGQVRGGTVYSYSEAEIQANDAAREAGILTDPEDETVAKWGDYVMGDSADNYREIKLKLPDIEGDFVYDTHFPDRNVVAFLRVDDRYLPTPTAIAEARANVPTEVPADAEFSNVSGLPTFGDATKKLENLQKQLAEGEEKATADYVAAVRRVTDDEGSRQAYIAAWADNEPGIRANRILSLLHSLSAKLGDTPAYTDDLYNALAPYAELLRDENKLRSRLDEFRTAYLERALVSAYKAAGKAKETTGTFTPEFRLNQYEDTELNRGWNRVGQYYFEIANAPAEATNLVGYRSKAFATREEAEAAVASLTGKEMSYKGTQRTTANTYFVDEFQSDWHQQARERGYRLPDAERQRLLDDYNKAYENYHNLLAERMQAWSKKLRETGVLTRNVGTVTTEGGDTYFDVDMHKPGVKEDFAKALGISETDAFNFLAQIDARARDTSSAEARIEDIMLSAPTLLAKQEQQVKDAYSELVTAEEAKQNSESGIPDAPFKDDGWIALGIKRAIVDAVEKGYDQIGWAGAQTVMNRWSERYAEAYTNQYDKKMPSLFKKLTGQTPAKGMLNSREDYWVVPITDELRKRVMDEGFALFQDKENAKRGAFSPSTNTITLLEKADLSTFLHEFGHFMLEVQADIASQPNAPQQMRDDMDALLKWYNIKGKSADERLSKWNRMTLDEKRNGHEKFARGFEAYLFTGEAPSPGVKALFQRFRSWLVSVYKQIKSLNVSLTKDVRDVMDRMLATDAEIAQAQEMQRFEPLFKAADQAGMTASEFLNYQQLGRASTANAIDTLELRNMRDMQWLSNARAREIKKLQAQADSQRRAVRAEVNDQVRAQPVYKAMEFFKRGTVADGMAVPENTPHKISTAGAKEVLGEKAYSNLSGWFGKYGLLAEDGMHPDAAAELFGFKSGDHLLKALAKAEPMNELINGLTDQRMLERYGDLVDPQSIERAAMSALANDAKAKFIQAELTALNNALGGRKFWAEAARQYAEAMVNRQRIRDLRPAQYEAAERKASQEAQKAFAKTDLEVAAAQKRSQLVNVYATKAAHKAQDDVERGLRYFKKFDRKRRKGSPKIDADYRDQIDALLEQYALKPITNKEADRRVTLREWMDKQAEAGLEPNLPDDIVNDTRRRSYKEMSVEEFRGLIDTVKQIEHVGRLKHRLLTAKKQASYEAAKEEILSAITANAPGRKPNLRTRTNAGSRLGEVVEGYFAMHRKMASLLREMDGFKDGGPLWEYIVRPMNAASDRETTMREEATIKLADITKKLLENKEIMGGKGQYFDSVGMALNREERISIALNLGNEGNQQRLLDGQGWTMQQLEPVLATLSKADWDFVQEVWDYFESYRPQIAAKERRVFGREPDWVKPRPVVTPHGTYRGGYYPIKYDPRASGRSQSFAKAEEAQQMMRGAFNAATTRRSFTKTRSEKVTGRPLLYSFNTIYQGTEEIIHDLTHHEWLIDATKFLRDPEFDKAVRENYGPEYVGVIRSAVEDIARGLQPAENVFERSLNHIRKGATVAGLGWNFTTSFLQPLGLTNSMVRIGPKWVAQGTMSWLKAPFDKVEEVYSKSEFMRLRAKTMQREINEIQNRLQTPGRVQSALGKVAGQENVQTAKDWVQWSMFLTIQKMQLVADIPTWLGQYEKSIAEGNSDERAAALADQAVIDAQGGGTIKDLAEIQRGGALQQTWTNFYSYFNVVYNLNAEVKNRTDWKNPYDVAVAARDYLLLMVVPAVLGYLLKEALSGGGDDWDDPKKLAKALVSEQISYMLGTMVGLREATNAVQRVAGVAQFTGSYGGPAGLRFFTELDKLATQVNQGNPDRALRKSTINTAGILFHLPGAQINRTWDGIEEMVDGNAGPLAIIGGPPR